MTQMNFDPNAVAQDEFWQDRDAAKHLVPQFVSRVFVQDIGGGMMRVSVGEVLNGETRYDNAFALSASTALEFAGVLARVAVAILNPPNASSPDAPPPPPPSQNG